MEEQKFNKLTYVVGSCTTHTRTNPDMSMNARAITRGLYLLAKIYITLDRMVARERECLFSGYHLDFEILAMRFCRNIKLL